MSMTTFGSRLSTCNRVLQKERLLTYGVISPGQSRGISPLQGERIGTYEGRYHSGWLQGGRFFFFSPPCDRSRRGKRKGLEVEEVSVQVMSLQTALNGRPGAMESQRGCGE